MQKLDEIKEEKREIPKDLALVLVTPVRDTHRIVSKTSGYPSISPLEADLMELMGDALGG